MDWKAGNSKLSNYPCVNLSHVEFHASRIAQALLAPKPTRVADLG
jgi:hypothetical protein